MDDQGRCSRCGKPTHISVCPHCGRIEWIAVVFPALFGLGLYFTFAERNVGNQLFKMLVNVGVVLAGVAFVILAGDVLVSRLRLATGHAPKFDANKEDDGSVWIALLVVAIAVVLPLGIGIFLFLVGVDYIRVPETYVPAAIYQEIITRNGQEFGGQLRSGYELNARIQYATILCAFPFIFIALSIVLTLLRRKTLDDAPFGWIVGSAVVSLVVFFLLADVLTPIGGALLGLMVMLGVLGYGVFSDRRSLRS